MFKSESARNLDDSNQKINSNQKFAPNQNPNNINPTTSNTNATKYFNYSIKPVNIPQIVPKKTHQSQSHKYQLEAVQSSIINLATLTSSIDHGDTSLTNNSIDYLRRSQHMKKKRKEMMEYYKTHPFFQSHHSEFHNFFSQISYLHQELENKAVLFPDTEKSNLGKSIELEISVYRVLKTLERDLLIWNKKFDEQVEETLQAQNRSSVLLSEKLSMAEQLKIITKNLADTQARSNNIPPVQTITSNSFSGGGNNNSSLLNQNSEGLILNPEKIAINEVLLQKTLLQSELQVLGEKLERWKRENNAGEISMLYAELKVKFDSYRTESENNIRKQDNVIQMMEASLKTLRNFNQTLEKQYNELKHQNENLKIQYDYNEKQIVESSSVMFRLREHQNMFQEDIIGLDERLKSEQETSKMLRLKLKQVQQKLDQSSLERAHLANVQQNPQFNSEIRFFNSLRPALRNSPLFNQTLRAQYFPVNPYDTPKNRLSSNSNTAVPQLSSEDMQQESSPFPFEKLAVYYPNFFSFIEQQYSVLIKTDAQLRQAHDKVTFLFLGTLRGILDSKFNEFLLYDDYRQYSRFADFVFGWLGSFQIDPFTRKVCNFNDPSPEAQQMASQNSLSIGIQGSPSEARFSFYINLHNPQLDQLWEVITFREFLNEECPLDQIFFYLHCRNMFFQGPELDCFQATFGAIHEVRLERILKIIENVMTKFDGSTQEYIANTLKSRSFKRARGVQFVDASLALRILLEYYRSERIIRYRLLRELFYSLPGREVEGQYSLSLQSFLKLFDLNFPDTTEEQKARLYRESYVIGRGIVGIEAFYAACSESNFFIKYVKIKTLVEVPYYNAEQGQFDEKAPNVEVVKNFYEALFKEGTGGAVDNLSRIIKTSEQLGIESLSKNGKEFFNTAKQGFQLTNLDLQGKNISLLMRTYMNNWISIVFIKSFSLKEQWNTENEAQIMQNLAFSLKGFFQTSEEVIGNYQQNFINKANRKIKKFQIWMRQKINQWYNVLNVVLLTQLASGLKKQMTQQK